MRPRFLSPRSVPSFFCWLLAWPSLHARHQGREPASIPRCPSRTLTTVPTHRGRKASTMSSLSRLTVSAGTTRSATTPRICSRLPNAVCLRLMECCPVIPPSHFPITSPSSPVSIPSTTVSSPTSSSIPSAVRATALQIRPPSLTAPGTAAFLCGVSPKARELRTASLFWVGSEAKIAGFRPTWYAHYDDKTDRTPESQQARIDNTVALLHLPPADRPHFIAIYYSEPDHEGHEFGPDGLQTRAAVLKMDVIVGKLEAALKATPPAHRSRRRERSRHGQVAR